VQWGFFITGIRQILVPQAACDGAMLLLFSFLLGFYMHTVESTVYLCTDVQSGNRFYTAYEPDRYEQEYLYVQEVDYNTVPKWGKEQLAAE